MEYNANDIETLSFREAMRERVAMYMGSADNQGVLQCVREIITNSIDEATMGFCDLIKIIIDSSKNYVQVVDNGRGVPFGIREDGENVLVSVFTKSHTGGKFDHNAYKNSSGLNGVGASCVCLSSKYFQVISIRDGMSAKATFTKGILDE